MKRIDKIEQHENNNNMMEIKKVRKNNKSIEIKKYN